MLKIKGGISIFKKKFILISSMMMLIIIFNTLLFSNENNIYKINYTDFIKVSINNSYDVLSKMEEIQEYNSNLTSIFLPNINVFSDFSNSTISLEYDLNQLISLLFTNIQKTTKERLNMELIEYKAKNAIDLTSLYFNTLARLKITETLKNFKSKIDKIYNLIISNNNIDYITKMNYEINYNKFLINYYSIKNDLNYYLNQITDHLGLSSNTIVEFEDDFFFDTKTASEILKNLDLNEILKNSPSIKAINIQIAENKLNEKYDFINMKIPKFLPSLSLSYNNNYSEKIKLGFNFRMEYSFNNFILSLNFENSNLLNYSNENWNVNFNFSFSNQSNYERKSFDNYILENTKKSLILDIKNTFFQIENLIRQIENISKTIKLIDEVMNKNVNTENKFDLLIQKSYTLINYYDLLSQLNINIIKLKIINNEIKEIYY
ncbi:Asp-tRNA(Asn)/Glu-tRNA(Gln) amidotransferase C subunit [Thermosipho japonicus]|uniref:Asp-tRNA(Asn)/Glu-tRNA(Gln) amidotransferase C subunit n=1 Tax=Thermosipho japonicus TaxID=90323 RepID=A0A841GRS0_9BACT|nr:hypothetical protein [Thermosipho japonicus]MBB6062389.1 Asp-tRNA(Asn)/Glu-tRNA(Gln) amidotransferase C subunit [Thermosipho japonicus]